MPRTLKISHRFIGGVNMVSTLHHPPMIQWELTASCNHDCIHCYNYWRKDKEQTESMSRPKSEDEYLKMAKKIVDLQPVSVVLTGGEPLLVFSRIKSSIELLQQNHIMVSINTNATLLHEGMCAYLRERGIHLFVSFPCVGAKICDEITNRKDSLFHIVTGLDLAKANGINFSNNIVVSTKNLEYVKMTADFLIDRYKLSQISITRVGKPINSSEEFNQYMLDKKDIDKLLDICVKLHKKHPNLTISTACPYTPCSINSQEAFDLFGYNKVCTAGKTSFAIDTEGNFKACPRDSRVYGNVFESSFDDVYDAAKEWRDGTFVPEACKKCKELVNCLGGCRVDSFPFTGRMDALDCISHPENIPLKFKRNIQLEETQGKTYVLQKDNLICVKEDEMIRLSRGQNYVTLTPQFYDFLIAYGDGFTEELMTSVFKKDHEIIKAVINRLLSGRIVRAM